MEFVAALSTNSDAILHFHNDLDSDQRCVYLALLQVETTIGIPLGYLLSVFLLR